MIRVKKIIYVFTYLLALALGALLCFLILSSLGKINTKASLTIKLNDVSTTYSGKEVTSNGYTITEGSLNSGDFVSINYTNSLTDVGSTYQFADVKIYSEDKIDVTNNYNLKVESGTITITKAKISIKTNKEIEYQSDYTNLDLTNVYTLSSGTLPDDLMLYPYAESTNTLTRDSVTVKCNVVNKYTGKNVSDNFEIIGNNSSVKFKKIPLTIFCSTKTKIYDSTPLTVTLDDIVVNGLYSNDSITYKGSFNEITNVSESGKTFGIDTTKLNILDSRNLNVNSSYDIKLLDEGSLNITKKDILIKTSSYSSTYSNVDDTLINVIENIDELSELGIDKSNYTEYFEFKTYEDVGTYQNSITIKSNSNLNKDNYNFIYEYGTINITKLHIDVYLPTITQAVNTKVSKPSTSKITCSFEDFDVYDLDLYFDSSSFKTYSSVGQYIYTAYLDEIYNNYDITIHPGYINIVE